MNDSDIFNEYRNYLFSIAYRMLGSAMDAEDMVQETYLRWQNRGDAVIDSPKSYLAAITTRLSIDHLRLARVQRETYVGSWLPEPILMETAPNSEGIVALSESISMAFMLLLESLSPTERAVFLLREVFDYEYSEVAQMVGKSEANCRQIVRRAKQHITNGRPRFTTTPAEQEQLLQEFSLACLNGDLTGLMSILAEDVVEYSDGGGKVSAATRPIHGAERVAKFILGIVKKAPPGMETRYGMVNGEPAVLAYLDEIPIMVMVMEMGNGRIQNIYSINNPDKLQRIPYAK